MANLSENGGAAFFAKSSGETNTSGASIVLSPSEAEEYCVFKRKKRVEEVLSALRKAVIAPPAELSLAEILKCAEIARAAKTLALRVPPNKLAAAKSALARNSSGAATRGGAGVAADAIVGGTGETLWKVKRYETKRAVAGGAGRITLILSPSAVSAGKFGETKREIKKVCKAAKKRPVTVALPETFARTLDRSVWKKIAALAADYGAKYLSVPFYAGAAELRTFLKDTCMLEVAGVENSADFKILIASGAESIVLSAAAFEKIRKELLAEAENCSFAVPAASGSFFAESVKAAQTTARTTERGTERAPESNAPEKSAEKPPEKTNEKADEKTLEGV